MKIDQGTWVLVADGSKALVLENIGDRKFPNLRTKEVHSQPDEKTSDIGSDKPGRAFASVGGGRSAVEQTDWHDQSEQRFLADMATRLDKAVKGGETKALVVIAPARAIGVLRRQFSPQVSKAILAEIEKDYVKLPVDEIARHIDGH